MTGCVWNWANGANVPTLAQWHILKPLLNLSDDFLPLIERIEAEREYIGTKTSGIGKAFTKDGWGSGHDEVSITKGNSEWEGWGTALKPAHEPICMARKPFSGTVAENCLKYGTGGINIDESRVESNEKIETGRAGRTSGSTFNASIGEKQKEHTGRFPANLIHDGSDEVVGLFPQTTTHGVKTQFIGDASKKINIGGGNVTPYETNSGSAARFFYCAKASKSERNRGCEGLEDKQTWASQDKRESNSFDVFESDGRPKTLNQNNHPTVKPIALMEYLINMVTKEGQTVLDPFTGSGTTLIACKNLGRNYIGIELEPEYVKIAEARLRGVTSSMF